MARAGTREISQEQQIQTKYVVPLDCFKVLFGCRYRDQMHIRLEGERVLLSDDRESRRGGDRLIMVDVPFAVFAAEWPQFLAHLRAKAAEKEKGDGA